MFINGIIFLKGLVLAIAYGKKHFFFTARRDIYFCKQTTDCYFMFLKYIAMEMIWRWHVRTYFICISTFCKVIKSKHYSLFSTISTSFFFIYFNLCLLNTVMKIIIWVKVNIATAPDYFLSSVQRTDVRNFLLGFL